MGPISPWIWPGAPASLNLISDRLSFQFWTFRFFRECHCEALVWFDPMGAVQYRVPNLCQIWFNLMSLWSVGLLRSGSHCVSVPLGAVQGSEGRRRCPLIISSSFVIFPLFSRNFCRHIFSLNNIHLIQMVFSSHHFIFICNFSTFFLQLLSSHLFLIHLHL